MEKKLSDHRVAVIGLGKLGGILLRSLFEKGLFQPDQTVATVKHPEKCERLSDALGIRVDTDNARAAAESDILLLCVKPYQVVALCEEISPVVGPEKLLISVAASVPTNCMEDAVSKPIPVIRAMPNTPAEVGCAMTAYCGGRYTSPVHLDYARELFDAIGRTVRVDEKHMNAVTGLSASGPAFIYIILESLAEAGVKVGLPRDTATLLAAQTALGSARVVLETGDHPALLKDSVTTPAGCTIDGILELEEGKLRVTLIKAVVKATQRAGELLLYD